MVRLTDMLSPDALLVRMSDRCEVWTSPPLATILPKMVRQAEIVTFHNQSQCGTAQESEIFWKRLYLPHVLYCRIKSDPVQVETRCRAWCARESGRARSLKAISPRAKKRYCEVGEWFRKFVRNFSS
ncbi:MAG: hypothetical protein KatS3mg077_2903 [Candidatus Binatia bacterium]|nr:MAG: hypothetical protein KatS3mg077_2903 [Candidatus Binatia bacterium]